MVELVARIGKDKIMKKASVSQLVEEMSLKLIQVSVQI